MFIMFRSHAQLKKLDLYLPVRILASNALVSSCNSLSSLSSFNMHKLQCIQNTLATVLLFFLLIAEDIV